MYWFLDCDGTVLYVGKAKNLKKRIAQYRQVARLPELKQKLVTVATTVTYRVFSSEIEALLAEAEYIRLYQPEYNILLKDDKSPLYIVITRDVFPRVRTARRQEIVKGKIQGKVFGPYQSAYIARQVLRAIRPAFRWCDLAGKRAHAADQHRPCFYHHLNLCGGACVGKVSEHDYRNMIRRLENFLRGDSKQVQRELRRSIDALALNQEFEQAQQLKMELQAVEALLQPSFHLRPDLNLILSTQRGAQKSWEALERFLRDQLELPDDWQLKRLEAYDVSNFSGRYASVSMVVMTDGVPDPNQYRLFNIRSKQTPDDYAMMQEALTRRQRHPEWGEPSVVIMDGGRGQVSSVVHVWGWHAPVIGIAKNPDRLVFPLEAGYDLIPVDEVPGGKLIQQLRDEAHRFAKKQVHRRFQKRDISR